MFSFYENPLRSLGLAAGVVHHSLWLAAAEAAPEARIQAVFAHGSTA